MGDNEDKDYKGQIQRQLDARDFVRKMVEVDCKLGRLETNRVLLSILTSQPQPEDLRGAVKMVPSLALAVQNAPSRGNFNQKLRELKKMSKRVRKDQGEAVAGGGSDSGVVEAAVAGAELVVDSEVSDSKEDTPKKVELQPALPAPPAPPSPQKTVSPQKTEHASPDLKAPNRVQLAPLQHKPVVQSPES